MKNHVNFKSIIIGVLSIISFFLWGCTRDSENKKGPESTAEHQDSQRVSEPAKPLNMVSNDTEPIKYEKGASVKGKIKEAKIIPVANIGSYTMRRK